MATADSTPERPNALTASYLHQCIASLNTLATAGFQEVAAVLQLISHQLEADPLERKDIFAIKTALNAVFEMTERYQNQMQWVANPFDEDSDNPQTGNISHLRGAIVDIYELANAGFSEINAVARLALEQLESGHDWKQPGIAIAALIKTAYRYQICVSDQVALVERSECITEPAPDNPACAKSQSVDAGVPIRGTGIHSSDVLGEAYRMLAFVNEVIAMGGDGEFPEVSSTEGLCYIFDDIMHRLEIVDRQIMTARPGRAAA